MRKQLFVLCLVCVCSVGLLATAGPASAGTPTLKSLAKSLAALQRTVNGLKTTVASQAGQIKGLRAALAAKAAVLAGSAAPAAGLGGVGDLYIDTSTWQIYGPKSASGWGSPSSLVGA